MSTKAAARSSVDQGDDFGLATAERCAPSVPARAIWAQLSALVRPFVVAIRDPSGGGRGQARRQAEGDPLLHDGVLLKIGAIAAQALDATL